MTFSNSIILVKVGGSTLGATDTSLPDVAALQQQGERPVIVHGGGNTVTEWMARQGTLAQFVSGLRVTDAASLEVAIAVLAGLVNKQLVASLAALGARAVGVSGADGGIVQATISNLHTQGKGDVAIDINAKLMDNGPFSLEWSFDPQNKANRFLAKGSLSNFKSESINPFLKTNLNAEVTGTIQQMYFTISGNELESQGDMKMKYDDFEFTVLKKDGLGVNKILTAVVNLFTKKGEKTDADGFRHGDFKVERNQTKSFFNYLWINLKEGLVDTMMGRGKKKD